MCPPNLNLAPVQVLKIMSSNSTVFQVKQYWKQNFVGDIESALSNFPTCIHPLPYFLPPATRHLRPWRPPYFLPFPPGLRPLAAPKTPRAMPRGGAGAVFLRRLLLLLLLLLHLLCLLRLLHCLCRVDGPLRATTGGTNWASASYFFLFPFIILLFPYDIESNWINLNLTGIKSDLNSSWIESDGIQTPLPPPHLSIDITVERSN